MLINNIIFILDNNIIQENFYFKFKQKFKFEDISFIITDNNKSIKFLKVNKTIFS